MALVQFPVDFPVEAVPVMARYLRKQVGVREAGNAAWNVVGWAGGSWLPNNSQPLPAFGPHPDPKNQDEAMAAELDMIAATVQKQPPGPDAAKGLFGSGGVLGGVAIALLKKVAERILKEWLEGNLGGAQQGQPLPTSPK